MGQKNKDIPNIHCKIKADTVLFFDLDGTLVDTNFANFLSYKKAILTVTKTDYNLAYQSDKRFNRNNLKKYIPNLSESEHERIITEKEECYKDFLAETKLNKSLADILSTYSKTNKTVLTSKCRQDRALETLDYYGLTSKFSKLYFRRPDMASEVINKFRYAISELNISPELIIAFENEETEITDAKQAGIQIINPTIA